MRLRRLLFGARGARAVRRGVRGGGRARPARGLREPLRRRLLRIAAQRRTGDAGARAVERAGRVSVRRRIASCRCAPAKTMRLARCKRDQPERRSRDLRECVESYAVRSQPDRRCPRATGGRGKSGLRRAGCRVTPGRNKSPLARPMKARNRATETSRFSVTERRVKRGNLHPEQHQVSGRAFGITGCSSSPRVGGSSAAATRRLEE